MKFLQLAIGFFFGKMCVITFLLPWFFQGKLFSAYEMLKRRFGSLTTHAASLLFLVTRNLGDGLRLFLAALVLQKLIGWDFVFSSIVIGIVTIIYTYLGGMRSVVWNDCIQLVVYLAGGVATLFVIANRIDGGWGALMEYARSSGKLNVIQWYPPPTTNGSTVSPWSWLLTEPFSIWAGLIGGAVLTMGTHGTDQMMVQRYLSARNQEDASRAIFFSGLVVFAQFALFLFIGVQLACFYHQYPPDVAFAKNDEVYANFLVHSFPQNTGLIGLMLAAILAAAMSTLSSSLNSSATVVINDFYLPACKKTPSQSNLLALTRLLTIGFGMLQIGIGILATNLNSTVLQNVLTIAGFSSGLLLGLFFLAIAAQRVNQSDALAGAVVGLATLILVQFALPLPAFGGLKIAWPWYALIGATTTYFGGRMFSIFRSKPTQS